MMTLRYMIFHGCSIIGPQEFGDSFGIRSVETFDPVTLRLVFQMSFPAPVFERAIGDSFVAYFGNDGVGVFEVSDLVKHTERRKNRLD